MAASRAAAAATSATTPHAGVTAYAGATTSADRRRAGASARGRRGSATHQALSGTYVVLQCGVAAAEAARGEPLVAIRLLSEVVQVAPHSTLPLLGRG